MRLVDVLTAEGPPSPAVAQPAPTGRAHHLAKRGYDLLVSLIVLVVTLPLFVVIALAVRGTSPGPAFFVHPRVGRGGRIFPCLKFRTMGLDAAARLEDLLADPRLAAEFDENHKLRDDPRVTRLGRFLRRTSLDELPQFLNVLVGHMSVVGPRPVVVDELDRYGHARDHYLAVRPGITGPWQVSGRSDISFRERVAMDRAYIDRPSLATDLRVTASTVRVIVRRVGAY